MNREQIVAALKEEWEKRFINEVSQSPYEDSYFVDLYEQMVVDAFNKLTKSENPIKYTTTTT